MRVELINTGSELLLGFTVNTHANYLGRQLADCGLRLARQSTVGDDRVEMTATVSEAMRRSDIILITGGLGPTSDDFTRDVVAELLGRALVRDETVAGQIRDRFLRRGTRMPDQVLVQALVPAGAAVLANPNGTAPGLTIEENGKLIVLLPGPPRELKPMFEQAVLPLVQKFAGALKPLDCRVFKVVRLAESIVEHKVAPVLAGLSDLELGYCARMGEIEVRIIAATPVADEAERRIRAALGDSIFGTGDDRLEAVVIKMLADTGKKIATAESCTGGLIANRLTNVSGSSAAFVNGFVTYSDESKERLLGVHAATLREHGAVSEETAREMAEGARERSGVDFAISATGIAGPTGGTPEKPVGLVFIGLASAKHTRVEKHRFQLDRETFKYIVSQFAIDAVRQELF